MTNLADPLQQSAPPARFEQNASERELTQPTAPTGQSRICWLADRARSLVALLALAGGGLLIVSELTDRLERVEGGGGMDALNLSLASLLALIVVCTTALAGDTLLAHAERHLGRRPGARLLTPLLAAGGAAVLSGIIIEHLRHVPALDGWIGIAGSALLLLAAIVHHHLLR